MLSLYLLVVFLATSPIWGLRVKQGGRRPPPAPVNGSGLRVKQRERLQDSRQVVQQSKLQNEGNGTSKQEASDATSEPSAGEPSAAPVKRAVNFTSNVSAMLFLQRSKQRTSQVWHFALPPLVNILKDPMALCVLLFVVGCCLYSGKILVIDVMAASSLEEVYNKRDTVAQTYNYAESQMRTQLKNLEDSAAFVAEQTFQGHALSFQCFLDHVARCPERVIGYDRDEAALLDVFRKFVRLWLRVFEQCSLQPQTEPRRVIKEAELSTCSSVVQVAKLGLRRMANNPVKIVSKTWDSVVGSFGPVGPGGRAGRSGFSWISRAEGVEFGAHFENPGQGFPITLSFGCFKLMLLSWFHLRVLLAIVFSAALTAFLVTISRLWLAVGILGAEAVFFLVLCFVERIETRSRLELQNAHLSRQYELAIQKEKEIRAQCGMVSSVTNLWRYRTMPHLSLFKQLSEQLPDTADSEKVSFLKGIEERLDKIDSGMGELWMWEGQSAMEENSLQMAAQQMKDTTLFIKDLKQGRQKKIATKMALERLDNIFGFLAVRVVYCESHTLQGHTILNPHIVVRIGKDGSKSFRARIGTREAGVQCPFVPVSPDDNNFELEVWSGSPKSEKSPVGHVREDFRISPGMWHRRREKLYSFGAFQARCLGEIEYDLFFADCVRLLDECWNSTATNLKRLESFLELPAG